MRRSGAAQGAIARELDALLGAGLLWRREDGRNVYYQANKQAPVFPELERLVAKTIALSDAVREALVPLAGRIEFAVIFGSAAHGQLKPDRGTDLVVIGDVRPAEVADALATMKPRRAFNAKVYAMADFRKKVTDSPRFFTSVFSGPPLFVHGEPDDFRRLGTPRWSKTHGLARRSAAPTPSGRCGSIAMPRRRRVLPRRRADPAKGPGPFDVPAFEKRPDAASGGIEHFGFGDRSRDTTRRPRGGEGGRASRRGEFGLGLPFAYVEDPDGYEIEICTSEAGR